MYDPHELERTPRALALVTALRDADAVVVGSPGYHGAVSGLVKNALDYIEDLRDDPRVYLDNTPWGCISCAYGWQAAVGTLTQLRGIGHALRAWPTPLGVAINSADQIWDTSGELATPIKALRSEISSTCSPRRSWPSRRRRRCPRDRSAQCARRRTGHRLSGGRAGDPVVLLHGGEFGASAEIGWEHTIGALAARTACWPRTCWASATRRRSSTSSTAAACGSGTSPGSARCSASTRPTSSGNSMGAINLLVDATSDSPVLPVRSLVAICGGGDIQRNEHVDALYDYDATFDGDAPDRRPRCSPTRPMPSDDAYVPPALRVQHRARRVGVDRGGAVSPSRSGGAADAASARAYDRITVPTLVIEGGADKLLPPGWAAEIAGQIAEGRSAVIEDAGHCPQIEQPDVVNELLLDFFEGIVQ